MWVRKGGVLLTSLPYACVLYSQYRDSVCSYCIQECVSVYRCAECATVVYCSRSCMLQDTHHGLECGLLADSGLQPSTPTAWLLMRLWLRMCQELEGEEGLQGETVPGWGRKRTFSDFLSHEAEIRQNKVMMGHIATHFKDLQDILLDKMPDFTEFMQLYGRMVINNFELITLLSGEESLGIGVYLAPSVVDHSCQPNAWVEFDGRKLIMRSYVERDKVDMSKVFISYIDSEEEDSKVRQKYLKKHYFFTCGCLRCAI